MLPGPFAKRCARGEKALGCSKFTRNRKCPGGLGPYCRPCHNAQTRAALNRNGGARRYHLRQKYGLEPEDVAAMIAIQGGVCSICEKRPAVHVDHDHDSGRVREILCELCNGVLGAFRDDPTIVAKAIAYLEVHHAGD